LHFFVFNFSTFQVIRLKNFSLRTDALLTELEKTDKIRQKSWSSFSQLLPDFIQVCRLRVIFWHNLLTTFIYILIFFVLFFLENWLAECICGFLKDCFVYNFNLFSVVYLNKGGSFIFLKSFVSFLHHQS